MRTEGDRAQVRRAGGQDFALGDGLRERIGGGASGSERERFVGARQIATVVNDARRTGADQALDPLGATACDHGAGPEHVNPEKITITTPHSHLGGNVENGLDATAGRTHGLFIGEVGCDHADSAGGQIRRRTACQNGDVPALREQAVHQMAAEKTGATGDQRRTRGRVKVRVKSEGIWHGRENGK